ncbi:hypothetical protein ES705_35366 [subsurface metagenome]
MGNQKIKRGSWRNNSPEFQKIMAAIDVWVKANNRNITFIAAWAVYDEEGNFLDKDNRILAYGPKDVCKIHLEELRLQLEREKDDTFVNW